MMSKTDRRIGEVLASEDSGLDDQLDPELIARLAAWFGEAPAPKPPTAEEQAIQAVLQARDRAAAHVDPRFHARLEDQGRRYEAMIKPLPPVDLAIDDTISHFDFDVWGLTLSLEIGTIERADDIPDLLAENTPQASLRDLYRPVRPPPRLMLHPRILTEDRAGGDMTSMIDELIATDYRVDMRHHSPREILRAEERSLRAILSAPWEDAKPDKPAALGSSLPDQNDMLWFSMVAADEWEE